MMMPGRKFTAGSGYRYGFNGKENDNEVKGEGGQQDYGMRIYDPRLSRFLSIDPITAEYPDLTPYQFASNTPIWAIDLDGLEGLVATGVNGHGMVLSVETARKVNHSVANWFSVKHQQGMLNVKAAEQARQMAIRYGRVDGDGITGYTKALVYAGTWLGVANQFAPGFSDVKDIEEAEENLRAGNYFAAAGSLFFLIPGTDLLKLTKFVPVQTLKWAGRTFENSREFYGYSNKLDIGERIALYKTKAEEIAKTNNWKLNETLSRKNNNRQIYTDEDGINYSLDTQHGRFEVTNKKGKHQGEIDFFGTKTKDADPDGEHDLRVK